MTRFFRSRRVSPAGRAPTDFSMARSCATSRYASAKPSAFDAPLLAGARHHRVRVSIGAAIFPAGGHTADELLSNSHLALSRAKASRRGGHVLFEDSIRRELETRLTLELELALAAERNE